MANFGRSFAQGLNSGMALGEKWRERQMQNELKDANASDQQTDSSYTPEQIAALNESYGPKEGETWNAEMGGYQNADGGLRSVIGPTVSNKGVYSDNATGETTAPKTSYQLGNKTQDTAFTPDDIATHKLGLKADIYSNYGKEDQAEQMRSNALNRQVVGYQIADAKEKQEYTNEFKAFSKKSGEIHAAIGSAVSEYQSTVADDPLGATRKLASVYNKFVPDGKNVSVDDNGQFHIAGDDGSVSSTTHNVFNPQVQAGLTKELQGAVDAHLDSAMPLRNMDDWRAKRMLQNDEKKTKQDQSNWKSTFDAGRDDQKATIKHWDDTLAQANEQFKQGHINAKELADIKYRRDITIQSMSDASANLRTQNAYDKPEIIGTNAAGDIVYKSGQMGAFTMDADGKKTRITSGTGLHTIGKDNTKAEEAFYTWQTANADAGPEAVTRMKRSLGLAPGIDWTKAGDPSRAVYNPNAVNYGNAGGLGNIDDRLTPKGNVLQLNTDGQISYPAVDSTQLNNGGLRKDLWSK